MCKLSRWFKNLFKKQEQVYPVVSHYDKKALLIGINKYESGGNLKGCVNDITTMYNILKDKYGFNPNAIYILQDYKATRANIIKGLIWLASGSRPDDELVLHYSGHGSRVPDYSGDEIDGYDEILCPTDMDWRFPLTDDVLSEIINTIHKEAYFTFLCDSCYSDTMMRGGLTHVASKYREIVIDNEVPDYVIVNDKLHKLGENIVCDKHLLLSGCMDNQTSADAYIDGMYQGAFTWALSSILKNKPKMKVNKIYKKIVSILSHNNFSQIPMINGSNQSINRLIFGGVPK